VAIAVDPTGGVIVTAPTDTSVARIDRVVHEKARWILDRLLAISETNGRQAPREFVSGETVLYLGRQYRLKVGMAAHPGPARLDSGWLRVGVPPRIDQSSRAGMIRLSLIEWYKVHAGQRLPERVHVWAPKVGVRSPQMLIREQRRRWGSCDPKGNLRLNWRVIQAPMKLVDYVVVHELVHVIEKEHSKKFWAGVGRVMPDYEARREELRHLGPDLQW